MEPFDHISSNSHHVVALLDNYNAAASVLEKLRAAGVPDDDVSVLISHDGEVPPGDDIEKARNVAVGIVGGMGLGAIAGALAFAIPGVGPVIGTGIWVSSAIGGSLGATVAIETTDYQHAWEGPYQAGVAEGKTLVAVGTNDSAVASGAMLTFQSAGAVRVDHFDEHGTEIAAN